MPGAGSAGGNGGETPPGRSLYGRLPLGAGIGISVQRLDREYSRHRVIESGPGVNDWQPSRSTACCISRVSGLAMPIRAATVGGVNLVDGASSRGLVVTERVQEPALVAPSRDAGDRRDPT